MKFLPVTRFHSIARHGVAASAPRAARTAANVLRLALCLAALASTAQQQDPYKFRPDGHETNKQASAAAYRANLEKYRDNESFLVLPGLVADKQKRRIEVWAESTLLKPGAACEFAIVDQASQHAYEALLISFAKPSAVQQAMAFIGNQPGQPVDPASLRYWARGECFKLSVAFSNEPPVPLETLLVDRRTDGPLPGHGFRFTGSRLVPSAADPAKQVCLADEYQPMALVSLFNTSGAVFEIPYSAAKQEVYQNTTINPAHPLTNTGIVKWLIEPLPAGQAKPVKDLVLDVQPPANPAATPAQGLEALQTLQFRLQDGTNVLNSSPSLNSLFETLGSLDRNRADYYLRVDLGDKVDLGTAASLAKILAIVDSDRGVRIEPPLAGHLLYRAFVPDRDLLDRDTRIYHPLELSLAEKDGAVSGELLKVDSLWHPGAASSELEFVRTPVPGPGDLRRELDADAELARQSKRAARPRTLMVFAPPTLAYGQLRAFLALALPTHRTVHVYSDTPMPAFPPKQH